MITLSPHLLIATATAFVGVGDTPDGIGAPEFVARLHEQVGRPDAVPFSVAAHDGANWDAVFVFHCGYWSHFDHRSDHSAWPLAPARTARKLGALAAERQVLREEPQAGDLFLQHSPAQRGFVRAGVVAQVVARRMGPDRRRIHDILTIEGGTGIHGELGGQQVLRILRRVSSRSGDRFIRWADLEPARVVRRGATLPRPRVWSEQALLKAA